MDPMRLMNDRKYGRTFLLLALFFLLSGGYLKLMALEKENLSRQCDFFFLGKRSESYIVYDTHSEVVFRHWQSQILEYSDDLSRSSVFRT